MKGTTTHYSLSLSLSLSCLSLMSLTHVSHTHNIALASNLFQLPAVPQALKQMLNQNLQILHLRQTTIQNNYQDTTQPWLLHMYTYLVLWFALEVVTILQRPQTDHQPQRTVAVAAAGQYWRMWQLPRGRQALKVGCSSWPCLVMVETKELKWVWEAAH